MTKTQKAATGAAIVSMFALMACGSYPAPVQRMADAEATLRGAQEVGAASNPQAALHLRLAQEELQRARQLMDDGQNKRAEYILVRAKGDADLALGLTRQSAAESEAQTALQQVETARAGSSVGTTTTTSATTTSTPAPAAPSAAPPATPSMSGSSSTTTSSTTPASATGAMPAAGTTSTSTTTTKGAQK